MKTPMRAKRDAGLGELGVGRFFRNLEMDRRDQLAGPKYRLEQTGEELIAGDGSAISNDVGIQR